MKLFAVAVAGLLVLATAPGPASTARADDSASAPPARSTAPASHDDPAPGSPPAPDGEPAGTSAGTSDDEPGTAGENAPVPPTASAPSPPARPKARMLTSPRPHPARSHLEDDGDGRLEKKEDTVLGGRHFRIKTSRGAVHVWAPPDYDRQTAGTVIYVHGYYTDADGAWREHELAKQFRASHQNALFIVPDAPAGNDDEVQWPALKDLRKAVTRANIHLPDGPVVVIGHSGAFRTVMQWVDHKLVDQIILLDALYAGESAFDEFIASGKRADDHKLIVVAASTAEESASFAKRYRFAVARERMPSSAGGFSRRERGAKLLYIRSQFEHMAIVTSGKVIPTLLRVTPLKAL
ncbi:MAG TPA: hypothetical protein VHN14_20900 [Kofleriaceae bacterium]|jgi:hypothetical protein|nr:hypothetical protein [Kofleriaceae bacterium]